MQVNIALPQGGIVEIRQDKIEIVTPPEQPLTPHQLAFISCVSALVQKMDNGHFVNFDFNIKDYMNVDEVIKVEWLPKSGNLKIHGPTTRVWHLVDTIDDALKEQRTFCCKRGLLNQLPKVKPRDE